MKQVKILVIYERKPLKYVLLQNGVRGLMLDMYDFNNGIWLCHSAGGKCYEFTAFVSSAVYGVLVGLL